MEHLPQKQESKLLKKIEEAENLPKNTEDVYIGMIYRPSRTDSHDFGFFKIVDFDTVKGSSGNEYEVAVYVKSYDFGVTWSSKRVNEHKSTYSNDDFKRYYTVINVPLDEYRKEVEELVAGKRSIADYKDKSIDQDDESTALISAKSKETLGLIVSELQKKRELLDLMEEGVKVMMEIKRAELDKMRRALSSILDDFSKKIDKIQKVIATIELYLGIKEDIVQIKEGNPAPQETTIHFWQQLYFMDEEVAEPMSDRKGLDYTNIERFDEWLLEYSNYYQKYNYEMLIPQQKAIICFKVRREDKKYTSNPYENDELNKQNRYTYILIRNGERLYRVWGNIRIQKLFPDKKELQEFRDKWDSLIENKLTRSHDSRSSFEVENLEQQLFTYKKNYIMLQGLMDRTEVFDPKPSDIQLLTPDAQEKGYVKFIYEDDLRLGDGRLSWNNYVEKINSEIQEGSRIVFIGDYAKRGQSRFDKRYYRYDRKDHESWGLPDTPNDGVYLVHKHVSSVSISKPVYIRLESKDSIPERLKKEYGDRDEKYFPVNVHDRNEDGKGYKYESIPDENFVVYYNPNDKIYNKWDYWDSGHERKNKIHYKIFPSDGFVLNYDQITLEDINFYLYDRIHRRSYLHLIPLLLEVKKQKEKEYQEELSFVKGLVEDMKRKNQKLVDPKKEIWEAIEWFKLKNKWKRSIGANDAHAWGMIRKRLKLK